MSTADLLQPPAYLSPSTSLHISQVAPSFLASQSRSRLPYPLSLLSTSESPQRWQSYETLLISCLRTGDNESALSCLTALESRFGDKNERVQALRGLYREAVAENAAALSEVLVDYEVILKEAPANMPIRKRRVALLKSMGRVPEAIAALRDLLDVSPVDAEAWAELADMYFAQNMYAQAVFCVEEVLLVTPNAWNIHARLGEVTYVAATACEDHGDQLKMLSDAMRSFCRSVELCEYYLRGYYGLKITTSRLLATLNKTTKPAKASSDVSGDLAPPSISSVQRLNELATSKLAEILRRSTTGEKGWDGYAQAELIAARELLDRDVGSVQR